MEEATQTTVSTKSNKFIISVGVMVLLLIGVVAYAFLKSNQASQVNKQNALAPTQGQQPTNAGSVASGGAGAKEAVAFAVEGTTFSFTPNEIKVKKGDIVKVTFTNKKGMHDFVIDEFNARTKQIRAGETDEVSFTATKSGTFEYYCSVGTHRQQGMVGKLIVE